MRCSLLALVLLALAHCWQADGAETAPVTLDVAVRTGLVDVKVRGRGSCSGDAVQVDVHRKVDRELRIAVEPGTVLESASGDVQNLVCHGVKYEKVGDRFRRVDVIVLGDDNRHSFVLEALDKIGVLGQLLRQDFDSNEPVNRRLVGFVNSSHSTQADLLDDLILADGFSN